jgi:hypothetical protein
MKGDSLWQVLEIGIEAVPTYLEVRFMCWTMSLSRLLLPGSVLTNVVGPMRHQLDLGKVEVGFRLLENI